MVAWKRIQLQLMSEEWSAEFVKKRINTRTQRHFLIFYFIFLGKKEGFIYTFKQQR